jgi:hypothetical protein
MKLGKLIENMKAFNVAEVAAESLGRHTTDMEKQQKEQLLQGLDSSDSSLMRYKSARYAEMKNDMNPRAGIFNPDLKLTGATHDSIRISIQGDKISVSVNDRYGLEEKYKTGTSNPFLLSPSSRRTLIQKFIKVTSISICKQKLFK